MKKKILKRDKATVSTQITEFVLVICSEMQLVAKPDAYPPVFFRLFPRKDHFSYSGMPTIVLFYVFFLQGSSPKT